MDSGIRLLLALVQHMVRPYRIISICEEPSPTDPSRGFTNAFGVFQSYYQTKFPDMQPSVISLIGCIQPFVLIFGGFLAGPLWDAGYCQSLLLAGTSITVFGYMMVSICDRYWQVMLAQGVLTGCGSCMLFLPAVAIIPQYFSKKKALANGIAASGASLGEEGAPLNAFPF